ncbi:ribosome maturation factor RimP [Aeromicrobium stalagmiti]|uniref:ribosome maturation factor RimP n=1 Tax=Aeromicrobium stalagmiti TaxID=2738988 RepID=UPI001568C4A3|nr:ribosome maturation factor RimP [Aeromicrobium stalagmiti]NRQ50293.1 ribosome maturation factor RimP [Aeromicrobium stalagmiti]
MTDSLETLVETALREGALASLGLDLEALELTPAGNKRVLRIAVDRDGGVGIDHITDATRALSEVLDASDVMGEQPYTLEVTSRGVDRPLTHPRHWRRNEGRLVRLRLADDSSVDGRIATCDDEGVDVVGRTTTRYPYDQITSALVQTELNRKDA